MPCCVLRASGSEFDVDAFLDGSPFEPCAVWRRGEPRSRGKSPLEESGFNLDVREGDFVGQIAGAIGFLRDHSSELHRLCEYPSVEVRLDFGVARRDVMVQCDYLPPALIRLAGSIGLGIELTQYPVSDLSD